ncbi:MAG: hypothetical protein VYD86_09705, partial [Verrucomicrobiota bacterium]|nr:hypothetical protein [Verrucomicrobiota bacterium]
MKRLRQNPLALCFALAAAAQTGCQPDAVQDAQPAAEANPTTPSAVTEPTEAKPSEPAKHKHTNRLAKEASP